jgi:hypothetical protein
LPITGGDAGKGCESWNERMWSDGEPIDPSPTIDQAVNGGFLPLLFREPSNLGHLRTVIKANLEGR